MGILTLTQLDTELKAAHGDRDDIDQDRRIVALNLAQIRIARIYDWNELQDIDTGVIGDAGDPATDKFEAIPARIRKIYSFKIVDTASLTNSRKLRWIPQRQWDETIPETQAWDTYIPEIYTIWKDRFEFWKIPDTSYNYEVRSAKWPLEFSSSDLDAVSGLDRKDDMIVALAASWLFLTNREMDEANNWWKVYQEMANNAVGEDIEEREIDIRAPLEQALRSGTATAVPWNDPFNRTGVE